jgi:hypothetical protein
MAIFALLSSIIGIQFVDLVKANFFHPTAPMPYITIYSPENQVYNQSSISLATKTYCERALHAQPWSSHFETLQWLNYSIDGVSDSLTWTFPPNSAYFNSTLGEMVYSYVYPYVTYASTNLTNLSNGVHFLLVYGETTYGSYISTNVSFTVYADTPIISSPSTTPSPNPTPSPTIEPTLTPSLTPSSETNQTNDFTLLIILAALVVVIAVSVAALVYFRKRKP